MSIFDRRPVVILPMFFGCPVADQAYIDRRDGAPKPDHPLRRAKICRTRP